ncbi:MAG TPA: FAD:protein FMN transferase [Candidatus Nitrosotalea sp.]|nr:FAD:protein FMN transferase [Candidatus Nitrosotalea sp.]
MGVPFRIVLYAPDSVTAGRAATAAFARIRELNDILTDYDDSSELSRLSRSSGSGRAIHVSDDLWFVLERSLEISRQGDGAFDITVGPLVQLWRRARRQRQLPDPALIHDALHAVGFRNIRLDSSHRTATLTVPNMKLDAGGIAKGYAIDEALKVLATGGVTRALVTGGGDMAAGDPPPGQSGWRIELAPLDVTNAPPARFVSLVHAGLATSGDLFQRVEIDGVRYSHIIDPRTGMALTDHGLVTLIAGNCTTADGFSKVVSVLGPRAGFQVLHVVGGIEAHVARIPGNTIETMETPGFKRYDEKR